MSWAGEQHDGVPFNRALQAAATTGGVVAPYLEAAEAARAAQASGTSTPQVVSTWLDQALRRADSSAFLHAGDAPVVFVYDSGALTPAQWQGVREGAGRQLRLVMDTDDPAYAEVAWGVHHYAATSPPAELASRSQRTSLALRAPATVQSGVAPRLVAATVSPGYDDQAPRGGTNPVVGRGRAGARYDATWDAALSGDPDWVLVTSWNEWYEGTNVEPGRRSGPGALLQTGARTARWRLAH